MSSTNLKMRRGDTKLVTLTVRNLTASGLTGYAFRFAAKYDIADADNAAPIMHPNADFTVVNNGGVGVDGVVTCKILPAETTSFPDYDTVLVYDAQCTDGSGNVTTLAYGTLTVSADVARTAP